MLANPKDPRITSYRRLYTRKERIRTGMFLLDGIRQVAEAIHHRVPIETLIVAPELLKSAFASRLVQDQRRAHVPCLEVRAEVFARLSRRDNPQGLACVARQQTQPLTDAREVGGVGWVALVEPQDPGNLGTILRTSDAAGCNGVVLIGNSVDPYHPSALRAAMGATFSQQLLTCDVDEFQHWVEEQGYPVIGTSDQAENDYTMYRYVLPMVLLMGSEREGLSDDQQGITDAMLRIPMAGSSDSLNLAVATSLVLYEAINQQRRPQTSDK